MPLLNRPTVVGIDAVILHIVDPPGSNRRSENEARGLQLSQRSLPGSPDDPVFRYFQAHVENALADEDVRAARFVTDEEGKDATRPAAEIFESLLAGEGDLVQASAALARSLHDIMVPRERISSGDLAVCLCRGKGGQGDWSRFVALLKIDPTEGFPQKIEERDGKRYVTVELTQEAVEVLPTTRQRLQKAAFVPRRGTGRRDFDLLLLDRQTGGRLPKPVARFFAMDFLGTEVLTLGAIQETQIVWETLVEALNRARSDLDPAAMARQEEGVADLLDTVKRKDPGETTSIDEIAEPFTGDVKRVFKAALEVRLPAREVGIDSQHLEKLSGTRRFRGSGNLKVEASAWAWPGILHSAQRVVRKTGPDYWKIVLHTEEWEEIS